jgi:hypothetical protein
LANTEKTQEQKNGERWRNWKARWRTDKSCREQPDSVEEASLSLHLSLGTSSKVVKVLSKVVGTLRSLYLFVICVGKVLLFR